jgi:predicted ABC-type transport system involved in lysophospholipase L1 biosynthesis ATPase subunit
MTVRPGELLALRPEGDRPAPDAALAFARVLTTLAFPAFGTVELFGRDPATLPYLVLQRVRFRLALVQGSGGLLSNRTVAENVALPLRVREEMDDAAVERGVAGVLERFGLADAAARRPHGLDAATSFRVRAARALAGRPEWAVVEGVGDWETGQRGSRSWDLIGAARERDGMACAVCLPGAHAEFEAWLTGRGGRVERFAADARAPGGTEGSRGA